MGAAWNGEESGFSQLLDPLHLRLFEGDRAEQQGSAFGQADDRHASWEIAERHGDLADDGQQSLVDFPQRPVRKDGPSIVKFRHGAETTRQM